MFAELKVSEKILGKLSESIWVKWVHNSPIHLYACSFCMNIFKFQLYFLDMGVVTQFYLLYSILKEAKRTNFES